MLASILKSKKAVAVNIAIINAFLKLKEFANNYLELSTQLKQLETKYDKHTSTLAQSKVRRYLRGNQLFIKKG